MITPEKIPISASSSYLLAMNARLLLKAMEKMTAKMTTPRRVTNATIREKIAKMMMKTVKARAR